MLPTASDDLIAALGARGRSLYVVPSVRLVVTRLGDKPTQGMSAEFWKLLMEAAPK